MLEPMLASANRLAHELAFQTATRTFPNDVQRSHFQCDTSTVRNYEVLPLVFLIMRRQFDHPHCSREREKKNSEREKER